MEEVAGPDDLKDVKIGAEMLGDAVHHRNERHGPDQQNNPAGGRTVGSGCGGVVAHAGENNRLPIVWEALGEA